MKRWLCSFCLALGVVFLLGIPQRCVRPYLHPHAVGDRSVLRQNEFVFTWRRALPAANPDRADPSEFFATEFGFLIRDITDDDGPPWLDYRGPPGANACTQGWVTSCKAASHLGSLSGSLLQRNFGPPAGKFKTWGSATAFS